eukprot:364597-Chlamydomonas_euryale.AAC.6
MHVQAWSVQSQSRTRRTSSRPAERAEVSAEARTGLEQAVAEQHAASSRAGMHKQLPCAIARPGWQAAAQEAVMS